MSRGSIKSGEGERREVEKKNSAPDQSQKERGESRSWIPEQFRSTWASCSARVRKVTPRPSAAISIRKNIAFKVNAYTFFSQHVCHSTLPNLFVWPSSIGLKTVRTDSNVHQKIAIKGLFYVPQNPRKYIIIASDFQKFPGGACPRTPPPPPSGARASPELFPSVRKLTGA